MKRARVRSWVSEPLSEDITRFVDRVATLPDALAVAIMPDVHLAPPSCVGVVVATAQHLYPELLGSDLGCGVAGLPLGVRADAIASPEVRERILRAMSRAIPILRRDRPFDGAVPEGSSEFLRRVLEREGRIEVGTVGRGNHFVEVHEDEEGELWLIAHSGSRAIGPAVQRYHLARASRRSRGFAALDAESEEGRTYVADVEAALVFAKRNRDAIVEAGLQAIGHALPVDPDLDRRLDCQHDSVALETHDVGTAWVHRKGAMSLPRGARGVVPGSMATQTFIVVGRDEPGSLHSSAHGAGRAVPRGAARRRFDREGVAESMHGITFDMRNVDALRDEAPGAYKDVRAVMRAQRPLVGVEATLRPRIVHKGG